MTEAELPILDSEPKSGVYVDHDDEPLTPEDVAAGWRLGETIDIDDDNDTGLDKL